MTNTVKIFLPKDFYDELLYQYEDKDADLRKLIFGYLKPLAKQGKMAKLNQMITARVYKDGKLAMEDVELKSVDLGKTNPKFDENWIPEKVTQEEIRTYELTISDRLHEDLVSFAEIFCARLEMYNNSLDTKASDYKDKVALQPSCFEQVIQDNIVTQLSKSISDNIDKEYDEEFNELEKPKPSEKKE